MIKSTKKQYCLAALEVTRVDALLHTVRLRTDLPRNISHTIARIEHNHLTYLKSDLEHGLWAIDESLNTDYIFYQPDTALKYYRNGFPGKALPNSSSELKLNLKLPKYQKQIDRFNKKLATLQKRITACEDKNKTKVMELLSRMPKTQVLDIVTEASASLLTR